MMKQTINPIQRLRHAGILLSALTLFCSDAAWSQSAVTYTSSGNFIVPAGVTSLTVECWGAGGGSGGTALNPSKGGGGGGGSYARSTISTTPGTNYTITVGTGGASGSNSGGNGGQGGTSSFSTLVIAPGGNGGNGGVSGTPNGTGGTGGNGATGTIVFNGGNGSDAAAAYSGAGGGSAGSAANGNNASGSTAGAAVTGGGAGAAGRTTSGAGGAGNAPGGGASGGYRSTATARAGGTGGAGRVSVTYTCPAANTLPYTMPISTALVPALPECTSLENTNADAYTWRSYSSASIPGFTGPVMGYSYNSASAANDWLFTQGVTLTAGTSYRLSFVYNNDGSVPADAPDYYPEKLKVMYGTGPTSAQMLLPIVDYPTVASASAQTSATDFTPATSGTYYIGFQAYSDADQDILILNNITLEVTPLCPPPTAVSATATAGATASVSWNSPGTSFIVEYGPAGFTPGTGPTAGGGTVITATASPVTLSNLSGGTTYQVYLRRNCTEASNGYSNNSGAASFTTNLTNDDAPGANLLTVGAGCTGAVYTNAAAQQGVNEPVSNCSDVASYASVWFKFVAPASGSVKVSTDVGSGNTLTDTRLGLFSATDVNNYASFNLLACDEDGGSVLGSYMSVLYATGLTPGNTYYIEVGMYDAFTTTGTFCLTVDELSGAMLSSTNTCSSSYQTPQGSNTAYTGWVPLLDASSKLVALVRNAAGGSVGDYTAAQNINTGAVRQDVNGLKYLDRNFRISNAATGPYEVQLFMLSSEQAALQAVDPAATLSGLNITRVTGETSCTNNGTGTTSLITQTGSGSINGVSWVKFTTPGFSNFFVNAGTTPLPVTLEHFSGQNKGVVNQLNWKTTMEKNFSHFELQRSADGIQFSKIATVNANRNTSGSSYTYTDTHPLEGINIYRLTIVDMDGKTRLSDMVRLSVAAGNGLYINVHPNPVQQQLTVFLNGKTDGKSQIQVLDVMGKVLQTIPATSNSTTIDMSSYATGAYMIRYTDNNHNEVIKVSKN